MLLIDDQAIVGEAVRRMIAGEPDVELAFCQDATQAVTRAVELDPTVILQDLVMPHIDGVTLVRTLRGHERLRDIPLIVLSTKDEPRIKAECFDAAGASDSARVHLRWVVNAWHAPDPVFGPRLVAARLRLAALDTR